MVRVINSCDCETCKGTIPAPPGHFGGAICNCKCHTEGRTVASTAPSECGFDDDPEGLELSKGVLAAMEERLERYYWDFDAHRNQKVCSEREAFKKIVRKWVVAEKLAFKMTQRIAQSASLIHEASRVQEPVEISHPRFTCPECGGHYWHTSGYLKEKFSIGHCDDQKGVGCRFTWGRPTDDHRVGLA